MHKKRLREYTKRRKKRTTRAPRKTTMTQFEVGDYVLYAYVLSHARPKLKVKSCGPAEGHLLTDKVASFENKAELSFSKKNQIQVLIHGKEIFATSGNTRPNQKYQTAVL